jgi:hypothetical protein
LGNVVGAPARDCKAQVERKMWSRKEIAGIAVIAVIAVIGNQQNQWWSADGFCRAFRFRRFRCDSGDLFPN